MTENLKKNFGFWVEVNKTLLCIFGRRRVNYGKSILLKKKKLWQEHLSAALTVAAAMYTVTRCWRAGAAAQTGSAAPNPSVVSPWWASAVPRRCSRPDRITRESNDASQAPNPSSVVHTRPPAVSCNGSKYQGRIGVVARFSRPGSTAPPVRARHGR